ncbi:MAG: rhomboid family intramembrane serine protease [candidate division KSB1 bacterium]|nr:rhomboid family intramembrane serine protease [candidate division KSB1 bacterium]MDZ7302449.1 rhomboid family intramembrane serine protease [candidate division KSB1 bacterium]MDZ7311957.1 rhomboid family intramembrane serine protease [candidate division KSB1 bacterium]
MGIYGQQYERIGLGGGLTPAVKYLIVSNLGFFILQHWSFFAETAVNWLELRPDWVVHKFTVWQLVTYMFLHDVRSIFHILMNMLFLWMFGTELERYWGTRDFIRYYLICGIGAGLVHIVVSIFFTNTAAVPVIGASGAIYGLLMAFGILFPNRVITFLLFLVLPVNIKVKYFVIASILFSLYFGLTATDGGVAHFAHLGGMLVGFLYLKHIKPSLRWGESYPVRVPKNSFGRFRKWLRQRTEKRRQMQIVRRHQQEAQLRERVDAILDKINEVGYENLTAEEKQILNKASQYLRQKNLHSEGLA